jgi:hypothetical protein
MDAGGVLNGVDGETLGFAAAGANAEAAEVAGVRVIVGVTGCAATRLARALPT